MVGVVISQSAKIPEMNPSRALFSTAATASQSSVPVLMAPPSVHANPPSTVPLEYSATISSRPAAAASQSSSSISTTEPSTAGPQDTAAPPKHASAISLSRSTFGVHMAFVGMAMYATLPEVTQCIVPANGVVVKVDVAVLVCVVVCVVVVVADEVGVVVAELVGVVLVVGEVVAVEVGVVLVVCVVVRVVVSEEVAVDVGVSVAVLVTLDVAVDVGVDVAVVVAVVVVVGVVVPDVVVVSDVVAEEVAELVPEDVPVLVGDVVGVESRQFAANVPSLLATIALFSAAAAASQCSSIRSSPFAVHVASSSKSAAGAYREKKSLRPPAAPQLSAPPPSCTNASKNLSTSKHPRLCAVLSDEHASSKSASASTCSSHLPAGTAR